MCAFLRLYVCHRVIGHDIFHLHPALKYGAPFEDARQLLKAGVARTRWCNLKSAVESGVCGLLTVSFVASCHRNATISPCCRCTHSTEIFCLKGKKRKTCVFMRPVCHLIDIQIVPAELEREISRTFAIIPI